MKRVWMVALLLARYPLEGTRISLLVAVGFALAGATLSMLRLSPSGARGVTLVPGTYELVEEVTRALRNTAPPA